MPEKGRIVAWSTIDGELTGYLIQFMAVMDSDQYIRPHALVEMNDGQVEIVELDFRDDFRFLPPGGRDD